MKCRRTEAARQSWFRLACAVSIAVTVAGHGHAQDSADSPAPVQEERRRAHAAFTEGARLARDARWAEALAAFETAESLAPHAITTYNIGACERALGRYTAARQTLSRALAEHQRGVTRLPNRLEEETRAYLEEIDRLLARVVVTVEPVEARLSVDGRPLKRIGGKDGVPKMVGGIHPPGPGEAPPARTFLLELDPGRHVLTFTRRGFADAIVRRDFTSGKNPAIRLELDKLPAVLRVRSNVPGALVTLDGRDLGPTPVDIRRPAGPYALRVERAGYETYQSEVSARPGEEVDLRVKLEPEKPGLLQSWWFWGAATVVVAGAAAATYAVTRETPPPQRQPIDGGSLGWSIPIP